MYTAEDISWIDIEWFGVDAAGRIGQFATGSGVWPPSPAKEHRCENEALAAAMQACAAITSVVTALDLVTLLGLTDRYEAAFAAVASRGVFAFDKVGNRAGETEYLCVAAPKDRFVTLDEMSRLANLANVLVSCRDNTFELGARIRIRT